MKRVNPAASLAADIDAICPIRASPAGHDFTMTTRKSPAGQDFTRLFTGLEAEFGTSAEAHAEATHSGPVGWRGVPWLDGDPHAGAANPDLWTETLAWLELGDAPPINEQPRPADPAAIGEELGLAHDLSAVDLNRIRRAFALRNHPDLCAPAHRELATQRMRIANMLIDAALQRVARNDR
jgi:hypothetical protein